MLDLVLRGPKDALLAPLLQGPVLRLDPLALTLAGGAAGLAAAGAATVGEPWFALALYALNRLLDGLDGALARAVGRPSDAGAYLDIVSDHAVHAAISLGLAVWIGTPAAWAVTAAMLAAFYVNAATWMYLSALLEKRNAGAAVRGETTSVSMPPGLVEGTESIAFYVLVLTLPAQLVPLSAVMAVLVLVGAGHRVLWGLRRLSATDLARKVPAHD
jgi:phosphatidylglycerophosphate synthase